MQPFKEKGRDVKCVGPIQSNLVREANYISGSNRSDLFIIGNILMSLIHVDHGSV